MSTTQILLQIAGAVALLLWAARMVRTGLQRAFGAELRKAMRQATRNRFAAVLVGFGITTAIQSSTATAMMVISFAGRRMIALPAALAVMLGADLGSTVVVQLLSFDLSWLSPVLLLSGVTLFMNSAKPLCRQIGRVAIGLGLMILALHLVAAAAEPMRGNHTLSIIVGALEGEAFLALIVGAALTWLFHSSVAFVLLIAGFAAGGLIPLAVALPLVLGANIGSGIIAMALTIRSSPEARRIPLGNLIFRTGLALMLLPLVVLGPPMTNALPAGAAHQVAAFHTLFNLLLVALCLPMTSLLAGLLTRWLPDTDANTEAQLGTRLLERTDANNPTVALTYATREALRMADIAEEMLDRVMGTFERDGQDEAKALSELEDRLDTLHQALKLYLADVSATPLSEQDRQSCAELIEVTTNLEHIGDVISKNLLKAAGKKAKHCLTFSTEGWSELQGIHGRVVEHLQLALSAFVARDRSLAQQLIDEKPQFGDLEREASESHLDRLRAGRSESIETSGLHIDTLRDLKRINSHITAIGYAVLRNKSVA